MDAIDRILAVKTRLTTIKGYAQLIEREIERDQPRSERLGARIHELNREIVRLVDVVATIEASMADREEASEFTKHPDDNGYQSSGR